MARITVKNMDDLMRCIETYRYLHKTDEGNPWLNDDGTPDISRIETVAEVSEEETDSHPVKRITKETISGIVEAVTSEESRNWFHSKIEEIMEFNLKTTDMKWDLKDHPTYKIIQEWMEGLCSKENIEVSFKEDPELFMFIGTACNDIAREAEKRWAFNHGIDWKNFYFQSPVIGNGTRRFEVFQERFELDDECFDLSLPKEILEDYKNLQDQQVKKFSEAVDAYGNPRFTQMVNSMTGQPVFYGHKYLEKQGKDVFKWELPTA